MRTDRIGRATRVRTGPVDDPRLWPDRELEKFARDALNGRGGAPDRIARILCVVIDEIVERRKGNGEEGSDGQIWDRVVSDLGYRPPRKIDSTQTDDFAPGRKTAW